MPVDPVTVLTVLGSLASITSWAENYFSQERPPNKAGIEDVIQESERSARELSANPQAIEVVAKLSPEIREAIKKQLAKREREIVADLTDDTLTPRQKESQIRAAKADICRSLRYLRDFNGGILPQDLCYLSQEMGCDLC